MFSFRTSNLKKNGLPLFVGIKQLYYDTVAKASFKIANQKYWLLKKSNPIVYRYWSRNNIGILLI